MMLYELDQLEEFEKINPLDLGIDEDFLKKMLNISDEELLDSSFIEELREY